MRRLLLIILPLILGIPLGAISAQDGLKVVATTTILADVAQNVAGEQFTVTPLIPADTDPHAFEPSTADAALIADADLLLTVGAGYEAFVSDLLLTVGEAVPVVAVSDGITILPYGEHHHDEDEAASTPEPETLGVLGAELACDAHEHHEDEAADEHDHAGCDPHVWHDVANVIAWTINLADAFAALDPANGDTYRANAVAYIAQLELLDADIRAQVEMIPAERRVLITNHEFMGYYAHAYGFEIAATVLPASATGTEVSPRDLAALIDLVRAEGVPAIFAENTTTPQLADLIAQEAGITVVTTLYSDALGADAPSYIEMMRANTAAIVAALS